MEHVNAEANHTLDNLGIAKNAREEKIRARDEKMKQEAENARMAKLYREHVLGEKPVEGGMVSTRRHPPGLKQRRLAHQPPPARNRPRRRRLVALLVLDAKAAPSGTAFLRLDDLCWRGRQPQV